MVGWNEMLQKCAGWEFVSCLLCWSLQSSVDSLQCWLQLELCALFISKGLFEKDPLSGTSKLSNPNEAVAFKTVDHGKNMPATNYCMLRVAILCNFHQLATFGRGEMLREETTPRNWLEEMTSVSVEQIPLHFKL